MSIQTLNVLPAYLGGYDPTVALTDWNDKQSPTLIITQDLGASAAYLVIGDEPEAADEVFEEHIAWPDTCTAGRLRAVQVSARDLDRRRWSRDVLSEYSRLHRSA